MPRGFGFVHHSIAILYHQVPNPHLTVRNFSIAVRGSCGLCRQVAAPHYFNNPCDESLQWVAAQVAQWPAPTPGLMCNLPAGDDTLVRTQLPLNLSLPPPARDEDDDAIRDHVDAQPTAAPRHSSDDPSTSAARSDPSAAVGDPSACGAAPTTASQPPSTRDGLESVPGAWRAATAADAAEPPHSPFNDADLYGTFRAHLPKLWLLWELMLLGEPLMVIAQTPTVRSLLPSVHQCTC